MTTTKFKWNEENTAAIQNITTYEQLVEVAEQLGTSPRSVASKLRNLELEVPAKPAVAKTFSDEETANLRAYVEANSGKHTYVTLAATFAAGKFTAKQIQGKVLALELTSHINKAEKAESQRTYSDEAQAKFIDLAVAGSSIEVIAESLGVSVQSARGKALSLLREGKIGSIPVTANKKEAGKADVLDGIDVPSLTVAQIAEATGRTERGIKTMLTRRSIACADYQPKAKKEEVAEAA